MKPTAVNRLRFANRLRSNSVFRPVHMCTTNIQAAPSATMPSVHTSHEVNQSLVCPRSSISCSELIATASIEKPKRSNLRAPIGRDGSSAQRIAKQATPTGTLT